MILDAGQYNINYSAALSTAAKSGQVGYSSYIPGACTYYGTYMASASYAWQRNDCDTYRHMGGSNIAYADGHTKWLNFRAIAAESQMAKDSQTNAWLLN